jgi:hypothetical protein
LGAQSPGKVPNDVSALFACLSQIGGEQGVSSLASEIIRLNAMLDFGIANDGLNG